MAIVSPDESLDARAEQIPSQDAAEEVAMFVFETDQETRIVVALADAMDAETSVSKRAFEALFGYGRG